MAVATITCSKHPSDGFRRVTHPLYIAGPERPGCYLVPTFPGSDDPKFFTIDFKLYRGKDSSGWSFAPWLWSFSLI